MIVYDLMLYTRGIVVGTGGFYGRHGSLSVKWTGKPDAETRTIIPWAQKKVTSLPAFSVSASTLPKTWFYQPDQTTDQQLIHQTQESKHLVLPKPQRWKIYIIMAISKSNSRNSSNNNHQQQTINGNHQVASIKASCYVVDASTKAMTSFHYSTFGAGGPEWCSWGRKFGPPKSPILPLRAVLISSANKILQGKDPSRPPSPSMLVHAVNNQRRRGEAYDIAGKCERFCCDTLQTVFLGERKRTEQRSLAMHMQQQQLANIGTEIDGTQYQYFASDDMMTPRGSLSSESSIATANSLESESDAEVLSYWDMWEGQGGNHFRGLVVKRGELSGLMVFFDHSSLSSHGLKPGYVLVLGDVTWSRC
jgi:hypothetical protein